MAASTSRRRQTRTQVDRPHTLVPGVLASLAVLSSLASSWALVTLNDALLSRHLPGDVMGGMGQGFSATGLEGGRTTASEVLDSWAAYAASNGGVAGKTIAAWWLLIDVMFLAIGGYGLLAFVILLAARGSNPRWRVSWISASAGTLTSRLLIIGASLGLGLVVVDLVENLMAALVIAADGGGPADVLRVWGRGKWVLAAVALTVELPALAVASIRRAWPRSRTLKT